MYIKEVWVNPNLAPFSNFLSISLSPPPSLRRLRGRWAGGGGVVNNNYYFLIWPEQNDRYTYIHMVSLYIYRNS